MALVTSLPVSAAVTAAVARFLASFGRLPMLGIELTTPLMAVDRADPANALRGFCPVAAAFTKLLAPFEIPVFTIAGRSTVLSAPFTAPDTADPTKSKPADSTAPFMACSTFPPLVAVWIMILPASAAATGLVIPSAVPIVNPGAARNPETVKPDAAAPAVADTVAPVAAAAPAPAVPAPAAPAAAAPAFNNQGMP